MAGSGYQTISSILAKTLVMIIIIMMSESEMKVVNGDSAVPCFFIFGDSLSDNGNNNFQTTYAKANYGPYGVDFPGGVATGRFNNGPTVVDYLAKLLGFANFIPPFATASGNKTIIKGINYASGGAGIRDETGHHLGFLFSMDKQLNNHEITVSRITNYLVSPQLAKNYLKKCIYYSAIGNNDYLNNYLVPDLYNTSREFTPEQYSRVLIHQYRGQIKRLYDLNARKIVLVGNGKIGCTPYAISKFGTNGSWCAENLNNSSRLFDEKLLALVQELNTKYSDARFVFVNTTGIASGISAAEGFTLVDRACCKVSMSGACIPLTTPCRNRRKYAFYDNFHPTTAVSNFTAVRSYTSLLPSDANPIDIKCLAELQL